MKIGSISEFTMFPNDKGVLSLWTYRRIVDPALLIAPLYEGGALPIKLDAK